MYTKSKQAGKHVSPKTFAKLIQILQLIPQTNKLNSSKLHSGVGMNVEGCLNENFQNLSIMNEVK